MKRVFLILIMLVILTGCSTAPRQTYLPPTSTPEMLIVRPTRANPTPITSDIMITVSAAMEAQSNAQATAEVERQILAAVRQQEQYQQEQERKNYSCDIIGNVNGSSRIYHCPGWRDYNRISMNPDEGDRFFCSETEARAAGFREPNYPHGACR